MDGCHSKKGGHNHPWQDSGSEERSHQGLKMCTTSEVSRMCKDGGNEAAQAAENGCQATNGSSR